MKVTTQKSSGVDYPVRYHLEADHPLRDLAQSIAETYLDTIIADMMSHPRSLQKKIGPSEMGIPCNIRVLHKLAGTEEPPRDNYPWKPAVGTAGHAWLEDVFRKASEAGQRAQGRWVVEKKYVVGQILGVDHAGSTDLYDEFGNAVIDHKFIGKNTMKKYRAHGPGPQYRRQAHLYGKAWEDRGYKVKLVMICFLPREGELSDAFIWSEPYDRSVAEETLDRVNRLAELLQAIGIDAAVSLYPPCDDTWCPWCGTGSSWPQRSEPTTTAELFS